MVHRIFSLIIDFKMKKIRLEFPLGKEEYLPKKVWLKVIENRTESFEDRDFTTPIPITGEKISLAMEVPEELELIEIVGLGGTTPDNDISLGWSMNGINPDWRIPGLKKVTIILEDKIHEVPVINERPDIDEWNYYRKREDAGWLFMKPWALAVYTFESKTLAAFHWHPKLIKVLEGRKRPIVLKKNGQFQCMWESGGKNDADSGSSTIICDKNGNPKKAISLKRKGSKHALIAIHEGDVIIEVKYKERNFTLYVYKIDYINIEECIAEIKFITCFREYSDICHYLREDIVKFCKEDSKAKIYEKAILAAYDKSICSNCKKAYNLYNNFTLLQQRYMQKPHI